MGYMFEVGDWVILGPPRGRPDFSLDIIKSAYGTRYRIHGREDWVGVTPIYQIDEDGPLGCYLFSEDMFTPATGECVVREPSLPDI